MDTNFSNYLLRKTIKDEQFDFEEQVQYFQWSQESTELLVKLRFSEQRHSKFKSRTQSRKELWDEIAKEMYRIGGFHLTAEVCDLKYRNMLHTYKKNRNKVLNGKSPGNIAWSYYEIFRQALDGNEEIFAANNTEESNDNSQCEDVANIKEENPERKIDGVEVPIIELRAPSARLSKKRLHNFLTFDVPTDLHSKFVEPALKTKRSAIFENTNDLLTASPSSVNRGLLLPNTLSSFEIDECRVFGETVGAQLSLINSSETRALAELKIQQILYAARLSKLKE